MLRLWAWLVVGTVAPIEFVHGRNKRRADRSELWAHFIAKHILEEGRRFLRSFIKTAIADGVPKAKVPARPKRARRPSIRDLFNVDFNAARKLDDTSGRADSEEYLSDEAKAFGALTPSSWRSTSSPRHSTRVLRMPRTWGCCHCRTPRLT